jgi:hypothetical protein
MDTTDPIRGVPVVSTFPGGMTAVPYGRLVILPAYDPAAASRPAQATGLAPTLATVGP